ncbi:hypothetical protein [Halioxenophilus sp. WMMB6]|nr:hypothetical protein [Halioxenophilus sp. WMMB6]
MDTHSKLPALTAYVTQGSGIQVEIREPVNEWLYGLDAWQIVQF